MSAEELTAKYITAMEKTLAQIQQTKEPLTISSECVDALKLIGAAKPKQPQQ